MKWINAILLSSILFTFYQGNAQLYFPPNNAPTWSTTAPATLGYCQDEIDSLYAFLQTNDSKAFILLKDGKIVLERYFDNFQQDSLWYWASAGKTLTSMLVGIAQQEGHLSINDPTSQYLGTGWTNCTPAQEQAITIRHQLTMTTGLDDGVPSPDCTLPSCFIYLDDPAMRWAYHNGPYTILDEVLLGATGQTINQYFFSRLRTPLGMNGGFIPLGDNNVMFSTPRSMARYGLFLLAGGNWDGNQILTDTSFLNDMTNSSQQLNESYGYLTWLNGKSSFMIPVLRTVFNGPINQDAPMDAYFAMGKNGQLINVAPSEGLVWIRMGDAPTGNGLITPFFNNGIWQRINELTCVQTSVEETNELQVTHYPNPVHDVLFIEGTGRLGSVRLYGVDGRLLKTEIGEGITHQLEVGDLPAGVYLVEVQSKSGTQQFKIVKD